MSTASRSSQELWVCHLGTVPYRDALAIQERLRARRQVDALPDTLLLLEHPPVYTRGRRSGEEDLPLGEDFYRARGIDVLSTNRGGRLTYHGPGQLVGYPIMAIEDVGRHLRTMEGAIVAALAEEGIDARSRHEEGIDYTGVWVAERKIASIGVHVSRGVTTHGFAVNVVNDLDPFSSVVACGLPDVAMTSIAAELERAMRRGSPRAARRDDSRRTAGRPAGGEDGAVCLDASLQCFRRRMAFQFAKAHRSRQRLVSRARLGIGTANPTGGAPAGAEPIETTPSAPVEAMLV